MMVSRLLNLVTITSPENVFSPGHQCMRLTVDDAKALHQLLGDLLNPPTITPEAGDYVCYDCGHGMNRETRNRSVHCPRCGGQVEPVSRAALELDGEYVPNIRGKIH